MTGLIPKHSILTTEAFESATRGYHTESRPLREIRELALDGAVDVYVRRGPVPSLTVAAEHMEDFRHVTTRVVGDTLHVHGQGASASGTNIIMGGNGIVMVNGVVVSGEGVRVTGSGTKGRLVVGIVLPWIAVVELSGATNATLFDLHQPALEVCVRGAGTVRAQGKVEMLNAHVSGAGDVKARYLDASRADLKVSGAGNIRATVREQVKVRVSGAGDVKIHGAPALRDTRVSGVGQIRFK